MLTRVAISGELDHNKVCDLMKMFSNITAINILSVNWKELLSDPTSINAVIKQPGSRRPRKVRNVHVGYDITFLQMMNKVTEMKQTMTGKQIANALNYSESTISVLVKMNEIIEMYEKLSTEQNRYLVDELKRRFDSMPTDPNHLQSSHVLHLKYVVTYKHIFSVDRRFKILKDLLGCDNSGKPGRSMRYSDFIEYMKREVSVLQKIS